MKSRYQQLAEDLCYEIDVLRAELAKVRAELKKEREDHMRLVDQSIANSQKTAIGIMGLAIAMAPGASKNAQAFGRSLTEHAAKPQEKGN